MSSIRAARQSRARVSDDTGRSPVGEAHGRHAFVTKDVDATIRSDSADRRGAVHDLVDERGGPVDPILYQAYRRRDP
jgi:hypothetical protein